MHARRSLLLLLVASAGLHGAGIAALGWVEDDGRAHRERAERVATIEVEMQPSELVRVAAMATREAPDTRPVEPMVRPSVSVDRTIASAEPTVPTAPADIEARDPTISEKAPVLAMRTHTTSDGSSSSDTRVRPFVDLSPRRVAEATRSDHLVPDSRTSREQRSPLDMPALPRIPGPRVQRSESPMIPDGNGTYRYDHSGFTAKVERDGTVAIEDKPSFQPFVEGPCLECAKRTLARYVEDPSAGYSLDLMSLLPKIGMRFDLTDWAMRQIGDDPYSYEKARFLDATRDEREVMRRHETEERLREALQILPRELAEIWAYDGWTVGEKKRVLFDLWDECAERGSSERVRLGRSIRVTIIAFIERRIPAGSEHAYTTEELEALNRGRKSRMLFEPYASPAE